MQSRSNLSPKQKQVCWQGRSSRTTACSPRSSTISAPNSKRNSAISNEHRAHSHRRANEGAITVTYRLEITSAAVDGGAATVAPHSLGLTRKTTTVQATAQSLPISVLDLVPTRPGEPAGRAIARSVELARHVEQLGYKRYWVAEHHAIQGLACSATPVLIGHIAAGTKTIRVGSGGVMLPNHAPLVVAEQFGTLEAIYPGRIDLGLGRAPGGDFQTMRALRRGLAQDGDDFPALLEELCTYLGRESRGQLVKAIPGQNSNVPITLLGSSDFSAQLAAALGLPFAFAAHFAPDALDAAAKFYRERFQPSEVLQNPYLLVAVPVIAASADAAAQRLFTAPQQRFLRLIRGESLELLPPVDSMQPLWNDIEKAAVENRLGAAIVGSDATVQAGLEKLVNDTHVDEVIVVTDTYEHSDRMDSYERVARIAAEIKLVPNVDRIFK